MKFMKFYKTTEFERDGDTVYMMCWIEPDGDKANLHFAAYPDGAFLMDIKVSGPIDPIHDAFERVTEVQMAGIFDEKIAPVIADIMSDDSEEDE